MIGIEKIQDRFFDQKARQDLYECAYQEACANGESETYAKAYAQGYVKGYIKGWTKANLTTAKRMKADGMPVNLIAKYTDLTEEEINGL